VLVEESVIVFKEKPVQVQVHNNTSDMNLYLNIRGLDHGARKCYMNCSLNPGCIFRRYLVSRSTTLDVFLCFYTSPSIY
jgi:hypothetical protein